MEHTFKEYLKQARLDFAKVAEKYSVEEHLELRTAIDSLLIAYDQATDKALNIADVVEQSEQLFCNNCEETIIEGEICEYENCERYVGK